MNRRFRIWIPIIIMPGFITAAPAPAQNPIEPSPNGEVSVLIEFQVKSGKEDEFEKVFRQTVVCARLEPGNIIYNFHKVIGEPLHYVLYEQWLSVDAVEKHLARNYMKPLFAALDRDLDNPTTDRKRHFLSDMQAATRKEPANTDPSSVAGCR